MSCEHLPPLFSFVGCQNFQRALLSSLNCARRQLKANFKLGPSVMCLCLTFCYFEHTQHTKDTTLYFSTGLMCRHINSSLLLGAIQGSVQLEWLTNKKVNSNLSSSCRNKLIRSKFWKICYILRRVNSCSSCWRTKIWIHISKKWLKVPNQLSSFTPFQKLSSRFTIQEEEQIRHNEFFFLF